MLWYCVTTRIGVGSFVITFTSDWFRSISSCSTSHWMPAFNTCHLHVLSTFSPTWGTIGIDQLVLPLTIEVYSPPSCLLGAQ